MLGSNRIPVRARNVGSSPMRISRASARVPPPKHRAAFHHVESSAARNNDGVWTVTFYPSRLARSQCSTLPAGSGLRDRGIDAGDSLAEYWRVIERATD